MTTIRLAGHEELARRWAEIEPILKRATDRTYGCYQPIDVFRSAMAEQAAFWFIESGGQSGLWFSEPGKLDAVVVTEMRQVSRRRVLTINFVAGQKLAEWWPDFVEVMDGHARRMNCTAIMAYARPGWVRFWKSRGIAGKVMTEMMVREL